MPIKSILIHLDTNKSCDNRLQCAAQLVEHFGAHLSGVFIPPAPSTPLSPITENPDQQEDESIQYIERKLKSIPASRHQSLPWHLERGNPEQILANNGLYHDLIVVSNDLETQHLLGTLLDPPVSVAVKSACAVLTLPPTTTHLMPFKRPLIIWDINHETGRATREALPFLKSADEVTLLSNSKNRIEQYIERDKKNILHYLKLHNIHAEYLYAQHTHQDISDMLVSMINKNQHDLVVMGAYGHAQLRELFFGNISKGFLKKSPAPVLLSH